MTCNEIVVDPEPQCYKELSINDDLQFSEKEPPFRLLLDPKSFILSQIPGFYPDETNYLNLSGDQKLNSIMITYLGYERQFIHNFQILLQIVHFLIGNSIFKLIPENLLFTGRNLLREHQAFLSKLQEILSNHSSIMIVAFIEALSHINSTNEAHAKFDFQYLKIQELVYQFCFISKSNPLSQQIENIINSNKIDIYSNSTEPHPHEEQHIKESQSCDAVNLNPNNKLNENVKITSSNENPNQSFITNYDGTPILLDYFKLPIEWEKYTSKIAKSILTLCPQEQLPDPQLSISLSDLVQNLTNLQSSIESFPKLVQISHLFLMGSFPIVVSGRRFIREGKAMKQCRKSLSERILFLFSDIFVYVQMRGGKYLIPRVYRLAYLRIQAVTHPTNSMSLISLLTGLRDKNSINEQSKGKPTIYVFAPRKSFILVFNSIEDRDSWFKTLNDAIEAAKVNLVIPRYTEAPIWFPDNLVTRCMRCQTSFSLLLRKHHCRCCGEILCKNCLQFRVILKNISLTTPVKVCQKCFNRLLEESKLKKNKKDEEEIMMENLTKSIPQVYVSSSDTSEEDGDDDTDLIGCP